MKNFYKLTALILVLAMIFSMAACGGTDVPSDEGDSSGHKDAVSNEEFFEWDGDYIYALTEKGAKQKSLVIPARCIGFIGSIFADVENSVEEVSFAGNKVVELGGAFTCAPTIKKVTLPDGLPIIEGFEFWMCPKLETVVIPESVTEIGSYAFQECTSLKKVTIKGQGLTHIDDRAFDMCGALESIDLPDSITEFGEGSFNECTALKEITLPKSLKTIDAFAFMNSGLVYVNVPAEVELKATDATSFAQAYNSVIFRVAKGSWADSNFEEAFGDTYEKEYN